MPTNFSLSSTWTWASRSVTKSSGKDFSYDAMCLGTILLLLYTNDSRCLCIARMLSEIDAASHVLFLETYTGKLHDHELILALSEMIERCARPLVTSAVIPLPMPANNPKPDALPPPSPPRRRWTIVDIGVGITTILVNTIAAIVDVVDVYDHLSSSYFSFASHAR